MYSIVDKFGRTKGGRYTTSVTAYSTSSSTEGLTTAESDTLYMRLDGTNKPTADLNVNSHKLTNVSIPTADSDTCTKAYVDNEVKLPSSKAINGR